MRIFAHELKKLWDWRILLFIVLLTIITWFGFLVEGLRSFDSLTSHGSFLSYQTEMFRLYGETLEPDELADFDLPGRLAEVEGEGDAIIADNLIFTEHGITGFIQYIQWRQNELIDEWWYDEALSLDIFAMDSALNGNNPDTLEEWAKSPWRRWDALRALEWQYVDYHPWLESFILHDERPVVVRTAERLRDEGNISLIHYQLLRGFSINAAVTGVLAVISAIFLAAPALITDRTRNIHHIQYSAKAGRKILRKQLGATILSVFILSVVLTALSFTPFLVLAGEYWNAPILSHSIIGMWLYDITFGQYMFILAGIISALCLAASCVTFVLARSSMDITTALFKIVPMMAALSTIAGFALYMAMSDRNIVFTNVFRGRLVAPEVIVCAVFGIIALVAATIVVCRETKVEVLS